MFAVFAVALLGGVAARAQTVDAAPPVDGVQAAPGDTAGTAADSAQAVPVSMLMAPPAGAQVAADPPLRVARLSQLSGDVSAEPASVDTFSAAELNGVLTTGDRVYTGPGAQAELEAGPLAVRLGGGTDLTITALTDTLAQFGLSAGSVHLRSFSVTPGTVLELDTADAAITVLGAGDLRVDTDPAAHTTDVSVISGEVQLDGPGLSRVLNAGDRLRVGGADPASGQPAFLQPLTPETPDTLDSFSDGRDSSYTSGEGASNAYLNADITGGSDLAAYGSWDAGGDLGPVWYPSVGSGWQPYRYGRWAWVGPWGWTWIGNEPWGFAPFHFGRWTYVDGRWGWIPGPPRIRGVYAPALVGFVGGERNAAGYGSGFGSGTGSGPGGAVVGWFPLGPREPYAPPYGGSTLYQNRVNASNIYDPNPSEAWAFYNQHAVNVFAGGFATDRVYGNRARATVAMPAASFAAGQPVSPHVLRTPSAELAEAPVLRRPAAAPERSAFGAATAHALPPQRARPALAERTGTTDIYGVQTSLANRPFFHHAEPPATRPGFEVGREASLGIGGEGTTRGEYWREAGRGAAGPGHGAAAHPAAPAVHPAPAHAAPLRAGK